jgi:hypothetical protein
VSLSNAVEATETALSMVDVSSVCLSIGIEMTVLKMQATSANVSRMVRFVIESSVVAKRRKTTSKRS